MFNALKEMLASKKGLVFLASLITAIVSKLGLTIDPDLLNQMLALAGTYMIGQGIADIRKTKPKEPGIATSPVDTAPKPGTMNVLLILFIMIIMTSCTTQTRKTIVRDCGATAVNDVVVQLIPAISTIAVSDTSTWRGQLDALVKFGEAKAIGAGFCAVKASIADLTSHLGSTGAEGQEAVGIKNLHAYLGDQ